MFHPLIKLLVTHPEMLANHVAAYARLATVQADEAWAQLRRAALLRAVLGVALLLGLVFAGCALLVLAALPLQSLNAPWLLVAVPCAPLLTAAALALRIRHESLSGKGALDTLRSTLQQQFDADAQLLSEAARP